MVREKRFFVARKLFFRLGKTVFCGVKIVFSVPKNFLFVWEKQFLCHEKDFFRYNEPVYLYSKTRRIDPRDAVGIWGARIAPMRCNEFWCVLAACTFIQCLPKF